MFTGLVSDIGEILELTQRGDLRVRIGTYYDVDTIEIGASIACDGVCLTVVDLGKTNRSWFEVEASAETVSKTTLGIWKLDDKVNLERALKLGDELGGHIVSGHVDGTAQVVYMEQIGDSTQVTFEAPSDLARFIAPKGSVTLNGTSLTVNAVDGTRFEVNFIPHTKKVTTWGQVAKGDWVNIEIDTLARYVARLAEMQG